MELRVGLGGLDRDRWRGEEDWALSANVKAIGEEFILGVSIIGIAWVS